MSGILRERAEALIAEQVSPAILQGPTKGSIFMDLATKLPNMTSDKTRMKVIDMLPMAYWVGGDTGYKQASTAAWDNVFLYAEELAVIVPIPEAVLNDADYDIIGEIKPKIIEAINQRVDQAVLFGVGRPATWPNDLLTQARNAGNNVPVASGKDMYDLILGENGVFDKVEQSEHEVTGVVAASGTKAKLRGLRTTDGLPIFSQNMQGNTEYALDGAPMYFPGKGKMPRDTAQMLAGDFSQAVYAIRQDITYKLLTEAVIQDPNTKEIIWNLPQQDMIALRVMFRMGWALPNYASLGDPNRTEVPFAYLEPGTPIITQKTTITVMDNEETPSPIEGAVVDVNGSRKVTDASGVAEFKLINGTYPVTVKAEGYTTVKDTAVVDGAAVTKDITLIGK